MSAPELSRMIKARPLPAEPVVIEADADERAALARRFGVSAIEQLRAEIALDEDKAGIIANGVLLAKVIQPCAVAGDDFPVEVEEQLALRFVRESTLRMHHTEEGEIEVELTAEDSDEIEYSGDTFDLGEAVAQTLGLALDPYAEGPDADTARAAAGLRGDDAPSGPLAEALAALKKG